MWGVSDCATIVNVSSALALERGFGGVPQQALTAKNFGNAKIFMPVSIACLNAKVQLSHLRGGGFTVFEIFAKQK